MVCARWANWSLVFWDHSVITPWPKATWLIFTIIRRGSQHAWHFRCLIKCFISLAIPSRRKWAVSFVYKGAWQQDKTDSFICLNIVFFSRFNLKFSIVAEQTLRTACKYVVCKIWWGQVWQGHVLFYLCCFRGSHCYFECHENRPDWFPRLKFCHCQPILKTGLFATLQSWP